VALLEPEGQFGTRLQGGKDHAAGRYIFTRASAVARALFPADDLPLLDMAKEEGQVVEPKRFVPVLPLALALGVSGIGTGFATSIPCFSVEDLLACARRCCAAVRTSTPLRELEASELVASWRGFDGEVLMDARRQSARTRGRFERLDARRLRVTELPVGRWTETALADWRALCDGQRKAGALAVARVVNRSTESRVDVELELEEDAPDDETLVKQLKLQTWISWKNMWLFDAEDSLRRFDGFWDVILEHAEARLELYRARRERELAALDVQIAVQAQRAALVEHVLHARLVFVGCSREELEARLLELGLPRVPKALGEEPSHDHLLTMSVAAFTREQVDKLGAGLRQLEADRERLAALRPVDLWERDLDAAERTLLEYAEEWERRHAVAAREERKRRRR
jgi:DNA topoisomerase-2